MARLLRVTAVLVACALAGACSSGGDDDGDAGPPEGAGSSAADTSATTAAEEFTDGDFYAVPDPLPEGSPGDLIRYQPVGEQIAGADAYRIMYLSESVAGDPIAVTGTALVPPAEAPSGGRRVLTIAHGTTGIADDCAPSKDPVPTELSLMGPYVEAGYLIAESDYEGLGTPGRHPYLVGESEGRGVLDAAKAARALPGADAGDQLAIFGYSQGGHGALWAGQLAADWAPEFDLVGTVAGAPATEIPVIVSAAGSMPIAGFLYMIFAGFAEAYDDADLSLVLTPAGLEQIDRVDEGCVGQVLRAFAGRPASELIRPDAATVEPWATLAEENNPGNVATDAPVLIVHSEADNVVPAALSEILAGRMCDEGQVVERRVYEGTMDHGGAVPDAVSDGFAWVEARFAGEEPASTCQTP